IYSNKTWDDVIFRQQLAELAAHHPQQLRLVHSLTRDPLASSRGNIWSISPAEGTASEVFDLKSPVSLAPIVANNTLYILDDSGRISAFRG
ncbi:MAG TPA: hypothetical protein PKK17_09825, partial [Sphingorhabdus lacus]|nr:hypothetical protein [Sphingorhabdus lacus]